MFSKRYFILFSSQLYLFLLCHPIVYSQDSLLTNQVEEVSIIGQKWTKKLPWAFSRDTLADIDRNQASLKTSLDSKAGLQAFNAENFAQDLRISIRGFGSRSAFGVRGIRIFLDDIPLTSPDGTTQLDELSIYDIQDISLVRSGMSAILGNAGGGAIAFESTKASSSNPRLLLSTRVNNLLSYDIGIKKASIGAKNTHITSLNHHRYRGQRDFSESQNTTFYHKSSVYISKKWALRLIAGAYYSPKGEDPGSITKEQFDDNPWQANARNTLFKAGEEVYGFQGSMTSTYELSDKLVWKSTFFYKERHFTGRLPLETSGFIELNRHFGGIRNTLNYKIDIHQTLLFGISSELQSDRRSLSANREGVQGILNADQIEKVNNHAIFEQWTANYGPWSIYQMLRYDYLKYILDDRFISDGIQSGDLTFKNANFALGAAYELTKNHQLYANISTGYEAPTLNELTNNPDGTSNFNAALRPEKSKQAEVGYRLNLYDLFNFQIAGYYIFLNDQIQAYELADFPGKTFYRNANSSTRKGIECAADYSLGSNSQIAVNYTFTQYKYKSYLVNRLDYSGNVQTISPAHKFNLSLMSSIGKYLTSATTLMYNGKMWLNDANTVQSPAYVDMNILVSSRSSWNKRLTVGFQINNVINSAKYSNFRANAIGNRYYEAATGRNFNIMFRYQID